MKHDLTLPRPGGTDDPRPDWAVGDAAVDVAARIGAKAILAFTGSGRTARLISSNRPSVPLFSFSPDPIVRRRCALMWGVNAFVTEVEADPTVQIEHTLSQMREDGRIAAGDYAVIAPFLQPIAEAATGMSTGVGESHSQSTWGAIKAQFRSSAESE